VSRVKQIRSPVRSGLYYLTEHALDEADSDAFDIYDIEQAILSGRIRKSWPKDGRMEILGQSLDGRSLGIVCRLTQGGKVRVITIYEDKS
jgi:hypothetical protein